MQRSITDLSWDELDALAQDAAEDAIDRTHDAGLPTFGKIEGRFYICTPQRVLQAVPQPLLPATGGAVQRVELKGREMRALEDALAWPDLGAGRHGEVSVSAAFGAFHHNGDKQSA